jgi:hypothetical protein
MQSSVVDLSSLDDREALKKSLLDTALVVVQEVATHLSDGAKKGEGEKLISNRSNLIRFREVLAEARRDVPGFGQDLPEDLVRAAVVIARQAVGTV